MHPHTPAVTLNATEITPQRTLFLPLQLHKKEGFAGLYRGFGAVAVRFWDASPVPVPVFVTASSRGVERWEWALKTRKQRLAMCSSLKLAWLTIQRASLVVQSSPRARQTSGPASRSKAEMATQRQISPALKWNSNAIKSPMPGLKPLNCRDHTHITLTSHSVWLPLSHHILNVEVEC